MIKIETFKTWLIFILLGVIIFQYYFPVSESDCPEIAVNPIPVKRRVEIKDSVKAIKTNVSEVKKEVAQDNMRIKKRKASIKAVVIREDFDSTATVDTVKKELAKAVYVVHELDSISTDQEKVNQKQSGALAECGKAVSLLEEDNKTLEDHNNSLEQSDKENKKEIKKLKRKVFWTKVGSVVIVAGVVVLVIL